MELVESWWLIQVSGDTEWDESWWLIQVSGDTEWVEPWWLIQVSYDTELDGWNMVAESRLCWHAIRWIMAVYSFDGRKDRIPKAEFKGHDIQLFDQHRSNVSRIELKKGKKQQKQNTHTQEN